MEDGSVIRCAGDDMLSLRNRGAMEEMARSLACLLGAEVNEGSENGALSSGQSPFMAVGVEQKAEAVVGAIPTRTLSARTQRLSGWRENSATRPFFDTSAT